MMSLTRPFISAALAVWLPCVSALAGPGTPPPFFCGKTYSFAKAVRSGTFVAGTSAVVRVDTVHFLNLVRRATPDCPAAPHSVTMTATLDCSPDPDGGPTVFGPFTLSDGIYTRIPIDVPIPAGPARTCTLRVVARVTFLDGSIIEQDGDQIITLTEPSDSNPSVPPITIRTPDGDDTVRFAHPGDPFRFNLIVSNNHTTNAYNGTVNVFMRNASDAPSVIAGTNNTASGVYSLSDPFGGDAFPVVDWTNLLDPIPLIPPANPHLSRISNASREITLGPGQSTTISFASRSFPFSITGAMNEGTVLLNGFFSDSTPGSASAGIVGGANRGVAPTLNTFNAGSSTFPSRVIISGVGPAIRNTVSLAVPSPQSYQADFVLELSTMELRINGQVPTGGTQSFSDVTQIKNEHGRIVSEFSFVDPPIPPDATIELRAFFLTQPAPSFVTNTSVQLVGVNTVPRGDSLDQTAPYMAGIAKVDRTGTIPDSVLNFTHQLSAIGVETGTFAQVPMRNLDWSIEIVTPGRYLVSSTWTAVNPSNTTMIGFDVQNDFRTFVRRDIGLPAPGITFRQIDYTFPGNALPESPHGLVTLNFDDLGRSSGNHAGFFNLFTDQGWVARNVPIFPQQEWDFRSFSTMFNLRLDGLTGDVTTLPVSFEISDTPIEAFQPPLTAILAVGNTEINAGGAQGDAPTGTLADPLATPELVFDAMQRVRRIVQNRHRPSVEQEHNQCIPAAVANSFQWLEDSYSFNVPHDNVPGLNGSPPNSLVGRLDQLMLRAPDGITRWVDGMDGKLRYIAQNGLADDLVVKHYGNRFLIGDRTVDGVTSRDEQGTSSFADWIKREIDHGEDVELGILFPDGAGHMVEVIAAGDIAGVCWLAFSHDAVQGDNSRGTSADDGGFVFSQIVSRPGVGEVLTGYQNATLEVAYSQSPRPPCITDVDDGSGTGTPDGGVTIEDLLYYLDIFDQGLIAADVDDGSFTGTPDGGVTIDDLLYFLFRFDAGC